MARNQLSFKVNGLNPKSDAAKNVDTALESHKKKIIGPITQQAARNFYKDAPKAIQEAVQPFGYFHSKVQPHFYRSKNGWIAIFDITLGPPVIISKVDLKIDGPGINDRAFKRLFKHLPLKVGHVLDTQKYEKTKQLLYDLASTRGYFNAKVLKNKIYINLKNNRAQIDIQFETGQRYYFGDTLFSDSPFSLSFLNRFLRYKKGKKYNYHKVERTQQDFINSGYFSQVILTPQPKHAKNLQVPIRVKLVPRKRYGYTLGAGFGTDTGPRATLGFDVRRVNQSGHRFQTLIQASQRNSNAYATYYIPGRHPASDTWAFTTGYAKFDQVTGNGQSYKAEASYTTALGKWKQTVALTYLDENYNIVGFQNTKTKVLFPNINWNYSSVGNNLYPKRGFSINGTLAAAPKYGISETSFAQARVDIRTLVTFFHSTRLLLHTSFARTAVKQLQELPFTLQLFIGGARNLRGYSFNQIGPGRNLFTGSIELQQRITGNWYILGFFDVGNVTDGNPFKNLNEGIGPGIAWLSPLGALKLTVANAITQPNRPWVIQFSMGPEL